MKNTIKFIQLSILVIILMSIVHLQNATAQQPCPPEPPCSTGTWLPATGWTMVTMAGCTVRVAVNLWSGCPGQYKVVIDYIEFLGGVNCPMSGFNGTFLEEIMTTLLMNNPYNYPPTPTPCPNSTTTVQGSWGTCFSIWDVHPIGNYPVAFSCIEDCCTSEYTVTRDGNCDVIGVVRTAGPSGNSCPSNTRDSQGNRCFPVCNE